tara:strand:- start:26172 stop:29063 length:2892 start_codon:yes stop_codon:yes gene_type:complete
MPPVKNTISIYSLFFYLLTAIFLLGCGGGGGGSSSSAPVVTLDALSITNVSSTLKVLETVQLNVTGTYSDASTEDLSSEVDWSVVDDSILSISNAGLVTALSAGTTNVTASYEGLSIQWSISVKALADLSISPTSLTLAIASAQQLSVTGRYTDNSTEAVDDLVEWESSNSGIASVSSSGEVLAVSAGTVSIMASVGAISSSLSVTVSPATLQSIVVSSQNTQIASGLSSIFFAKGIYSDGTEQNLSDQVVWSVSDSSKASIDSGTGLLTALQAGTTSVIAEKEGLTGSLLVTVSPAELTDIAITPSVISLAKGSSADVNVTAIFSDKSKQDVSDQLEWNNTNNQVASIANNAYTVLALVEGTTTLSASLSGQTADLSVTVTGAELESLSLYPVNASIPLGRSQQYSAQGIYTDGSVQDVTSQVTWLSSNEGQVLISNTQSLKGLAEAVAVGSTTVTAVIGDVQQDTILTIEDASLNTIEIQPASQTVAKGTDAQVKAFGYYSDGSKIDLTSKVIWNTPNASFIDALSASSGVVYSINEGSALISAELDGVSSLANITVSAATLQSISISSTQTDVPSGMTQRLVATGTYSDTSTKDLSQQVTWQSNDVELATVSNNNTESGLLRALSPGQLTVTASFGGVSDQIVIDVTNAVLTALQVNSPSAQLNVNSSVLMTATASYSDSSTQDVSSQVNWSSSNVNVASVGNSASDKGLVKSLSVGTSNIIASLNGISSAFVPLEVTLNPNLPKALNLSVQPNIILNNDTDTAQINLTLVPSVEGGVIDDDTLIILSITEGNDSRDVNLFTIDGAVSYSLQSNYDGFIALSASSSDFSVSSGLLSTDDLSDALLATGRSNVVYENDTLKTGSVFFVLLRNLSNRVFNIDQIDIGYLDPNNNNTPTAFPDMPLTQDQFTSDGELTAGEFTSIGYELDFDVEASIYIISYLFSDDDSGSSFKLDGEFNFAQ